MTRLKKVFFEIWPFLLIILAILVFFWQFFLKGLVPLPADIPVGMYFPWLDYKWGYAVGVPVKNSLLSDVISQIYPFKVYLIESLKKGIIPLWNPFMFGGYPFLANIQVGFFNLTNLFYLFLPFLTAWGLQTAFQPLLAATFTYLFLRSLNLTKMASVFGGLIYAFSGFMIIWLEWNVHGYAMAFLPLLLFLTNKYYQTGKTYFGPLISLALAGEIFAGYPQLIVYLGLALLIFVATQFGLFQKRTFFWLGWLVLGVTLSSIQLLPTAELFWMSQRRLETLSFEQSFLPWQHLISFLAPDFFGNNVTGNFWGKGDYTNNVGYTGLTALILTGLALKRIRKEKAVFFFVLLLTLSLILALPTPVAIFFARFNGAMAATRILFLANFSLASLAGLAYHFLSKEKGKLSDLKWVLPLFLVLAGLFFFSWQEYRHSALINLRVGLRNLFLPGAIALTVGTFLVLAQFRNQLLKKVSLVAIFILAIAELFRFGWKYTPFIRKELVFPETPVIRFLKERPGIFRVEGGDAVPMNMLMAYNVQSLSAYDPMYPQRLAQFLSLIEGGKIDSPQTRYGQLDSYDSPLFDLNNIGYVLAVKRDSQERPDPYGNSLNWKFKLAKLKPVFEDKSVVVLENTNCLPRAFLVRHYLVEETAEQIAARLQAREFDPQKTVVLEKEPGVILAGEIEAGETVEPTVFNPGREEFLVTVKKPALLLLSESDYPGWEATIDGQKTEIFRSDFALQSVLVPAGEHQVRFVYRPISFRLGLSISGVSLAFLLLIVLRRLL